MIIILIFAALFLLAKSKQQADQPTTQTPETTLNTIPGIIPSHSFGTPYRADDGKYYSAVYLQTPAFSYIAMQRVLIIGPFDHVPTTLEMEQKLTGDISCGKTPICNVIYASTQSAGKFLV